MANYEATGSRTITLKHEGEYSDARKAAKAFFEEHKTFPEYVCEMSDDEDASSVCHTVVTACESCGEAVFEGEEYFSGDDYDVCGKCGA